ncbi:MAG: D-alanyl-D-alanine carboxypeptidase/D-alanyl-D-alanine-endopeptidase, partial [Pseudomonadota bacterium]
MLAGLMAGAAMPAFADGPLASLRPQVRPTSIGPGSGNAIVARAQLSGTTAYVAMRKDGSVLDARLADVPLPPASVAKALTALYAVEHLGADYRFATVLLGTGPIEGGVLQGDLILKGTGDPILDTDALGGLAAQLAAAGVTGITGRFLVDGRSLPELIQIDPEQLPQSAYNPSISGLNLNYNRVYFEWRRREGGYRLSMDARARKFQPRVSHTTMEIAPEAWPIYTHDLPESGEAWTVARRALGEGGARWLPVRRPPGYAGDVFRTLAKNAGVTLPPVELETEPQRGAVLATHVSPHVRGLCGGMLKYSTNLTAEVLGLRASQARGRAPETLEGSAALMNAWLSERFGEEIALVDHSGLGSASRVTCRALARVLTQTEALAPMLKSIPVRDEKGAAVESAGHQIHAKTGTLHFVSALAGYATPKSGEPLIFAIISSDLDRRAAVPEVDKERPPGAKAYARRAR